MELFDYASQIITSKGRPVSHYSKKSIFSETYDVKCTEEENEKENQEDNEEENQEDNEEDNEKENQEDNEKENLLTTIKTETGLDEDSKSVIHDNEDSKFLKYTIPMYPMYTTYPTYMRRRNVLKKLLLDRLECIYRNEQIHHVAIRTRFIHMNNYINGKEKLPEDFLFNSSSEDIERSYLDNSFRLLKQKLAFNVNDFSDAVSDYEYDLLRFEYNTKNKYLTFSPEDELYAHMNCTNMYKKAIAEARREHKDYLRDIRFGYNLYPFGTYDSRFHKGG
jgi:hypothetical protein